MVANKTIPAFVLGAVVGGAITFFGANPSELQAGQYAAQFSSH